MNEGPGTKWGDRRAEQFSHLANYTLTHSGHTMVIIIIINHPTCRKAFRFAVVLFLPDVRSATQLGMGVSGE